MKVYDCFLFNNELDVLEIRLNELYDHVDYFYIVEASVTHSGKPKPLYLKEALEHTNRFDKFKSKIINIDTDLDLTKSVLVDKNMTDAWNRENIQRNYLMSVMLKASADDIILLSDADEIPSKAFIDARKQVPKEKHPFLVCKQYFYYYTFRYAKKELCHGTIAFYRNHIGDMMYQDLRNARFRLPYVSNAGWHLSFFGSPEHVKDKIESFAHTEFGAHNNIDTIKKNIESGLDIFNRNSPDETLMKIENNINVPTYVLNNKEKYKHLF